MLRSEVWITSARQASIYYWDYAKLVCCTMSKRVRFSDDTISAKVSRSEDLQEQPSTSSVSQLLDFVLVIVTAKLYFKHVWKTQCLYTCLHGQEDFTSLKYNVFYDEYLHVTGNSFAIDKKKLYPRFCTHNTLSNVTCSKCSLHAKSIPVQWYMHTQVKRLLSPH